MLAHHLLTDSVRRSVWMSAVSERLVIQFSSGNAFLTPVGDAARAVVTQRSCVTPAQAAAKETMRSLRRSVDGEHLMRF